MAAQDSNKDIQSQSTHAHHARSMALGRRPGKAKKVILWGLAIVVVLLIAVVAFAPMLASRFGKGIAEEALNKDISGTYVIENLSLSWGGPQVVGPVKLLDPSGAVVGEADISAGAGLLSLATGGLDLGEVGVKLRADIKQVVSPSGKDRTTNLEEALRPRAGVASVPRPGPAQPGTAGSATQEVRLPAGLAARLRVTDSEVKYTGELTPGSGVRTIGITGLTATGDFALGQPFKLSATANTLDGQRALQLDATADSLTQADGLLTLDKAVADAKIEGAIPAAYLELIAARGGTGSGGPASAANTDPPARIGAHVLLKDGRLTLADPGRPAFIEVKVPAAALAIPGKDGAAPPLNVTERPTISFLIEVLDLPVPMGRTTAPDYRGGKITALIRSTRMSGTAAVGGSGPQAARPFGVEPYELRLGTRDLVEGIGLLGEITTTLDGANAGRIVLDLTAADLLDAAGAMREGGPGRLRGRFVIENVPTAILQPFAQPAGIDLAEALGPKLQADLRAGVIAPGSAAMPSASALAGGTAPATGAAANEAGEATTSPYVSGTVVSDKTRVWFDMYIDQDKIRSRNEGVKVQTTALGYLVRRFMPEGTPVTITGAGIAGLEAATFELPGVLSGKGLDFSGTRADVRVYGGELVAQLNGHGSPVSIDSLDVSAVIDGEKSPKVRMDHLLGYEGQKMKAHGDLTVDGLFKKDASAPGGVALSIKDARPQGTISVTDVPASIASVAGEQARRIADAAVGSKLNLDITALPGESGSSSVDLELKSAGTNGTGQLVVGGGRVKTVGEGFVLTLAKPADVLNAVLNTPGASGAQGGAKVVVDSNSDLTVRLSGIDVALGDSSIKPSTLAAKASVSTAGMGLTLNGPGGSGKGERVEISSVMARAVLDGKGGADLTVDSRGVFQGAVFTASGTLGAGKVLNDGGVDIRTIEPRGSITLSQVPSSLVALVSPENAVLAQAVLGGTVDAQLAAITDGKGLEFTMTTPQVKARSRAVIAGDKLTVGPTSAEASLSPRTLDTVLALKAPDLTPRPALAGVSRFVAEVTPVTLPIKGPTEVGTNPLGGYRASVRTDGDMVVNNATTLGAGTPSARPLNVGIRLMGAALAMNTDPARPLGDITASLDIFDPANPGPTIAKVRLDGGRMLPEQLREMTVDVPSTVAIDRWLGTPELASLALGDSLKIMSMGQPVTQAGAGVVVTSIVESPKLQTRIAVAMNDLGTKVQPFDATWTLDPALANRYLFVDAAGKATARLSRAVKTTLVVRSLEIGPSGKPLDPRVFKADIAFNAPGLAIVTPDGVEADLGNLQGSLKNGGPGAVAFDLSTAGVKLTSTGGKAAPNGGETKPLTIKGTLEDLADASGVLTPDRAVVTSKIEGGLPTPLLDALSGQAGALVDLLGARVDTAINTTRLGKQSGTLSANLVADNATASAEGEIRAGTFVAGKQVIARMSRISPEASKRFISTVVPILDKLEKTKDDKPAVITADGLTAPLDGDMSKLNADLMFDLGTVQFQSSDFFGEILKATSNKSVGRIGQKIPPFKAKVRQGVINYERFTIPTGEFELSTEGKVDLVKKKMRLTVWVPLFALADEITGLLKVGSLPGLGDLSSIPLKISGDLDKPDIDIDWEKMGQDILKVPGKAADGAGGGVDELIKGVGDLFKKKKRK
jgi:hypothetical protein